MSFCSLKRLSEEEAAEGQSELRPISLDPPGPSIPIALHTTMGPCPPPGEAAASCALYPSAYTAPSNTAVNGQAKPSCASGPLPGPSSPGVPGSLTYSCSPSSALCQQQGCQGPRHLKEQSLFTLSLLSLFSSRQGAERHQTRCHQMSAPRSLHTYLSCIYQLAYCPAPAHFLSPTTLSQILEEGLADKECPTDRRSQHCCS